ncbi:succinyldiaminopimelate aminotransferase apoenzyme [Nitrosomonas sp. PY1]|uniref:succinyldiaminopimelate transaminase n=1 Tax=Nitrosomonas sp. PY1 TaxID=1803906 RepID=UPI001FC89F80|nr:succinyldiaminopimelate transaminase [Nitrosomonas sp. PY1]GKS69749.1 succinyldiaminopimelate aminotransferase apoenzyme [Nitrosomonas sp. PY1]
MNPKLNQLQLYPFQKLKQLLGGVTRNSALSAINLQIGEPKHAAPEFIRQAMIDHINGLSAYPMTLGSISLRNTLANWIQKRFNLTEINPDTEVIPVNGSREALFSFAQAVINTDKDRAMVICPNPFYQIYEGAVLLAGAEPYFINASSKNHFACDFSQVSDVIWSNTQLVYVCSPSNPTGRVMTLGEWKQLFELSDRYGFIIASDECYSEIYFAEASPPLGALDAAQQMGRYGFPRLIVFNSLSKRSNVPGLRSGFVAGDAQILEKFLLYRTYHGSAMSPVTQAASSAAWNDETHVIENRRLYTQKFSDAMRILSDVINIQMPDAGFYFWLETPISDTEFTKRLYQDYNVTVLPGSYLARDVHGVNPGANYVRIALVTTPLECAEAMQRIKDFISDLN